MIDEENRNKFTDWWAKETELLQNSGMVANSHEQSVAENAAWRGFKLGLETAEWRTQQGITI